MPMANERRSFGKIQRLPTVVGSNPPPLIKYDAAVSLISAVISLQIRICKFFLIYLETAERNAEAKCDKVFEPAVKIGGKEGAIVAAEEKSQVAEPTKLEQTKTRRSSRSRRTVARKATAIEEHDEKKGEEPAEKWKAAQQAGTVVADKAVLPITSNNCEHQKIERKEGNDLVRAASEPQRAEAVKGEEREKEIFERSEETQGSISQEEQSSEINEERTQEEDNYETTRKHSKIDVQPNQTEVVLEHVRKEETKIHLEVIKGEDDKKQAVEKKLEIKKEEKKKDANEKLEVKRLADEKEKKKVAQGKHEKKLPRENIIPKEVSKNNIIAKDKEKKKVNEVGPKVKQAGEKICFKEKPAAQAAIGSRESRRSKELVKRSIVKNDTKEEPKKKVTSKEGLSGGTSKHKGKQTKANSSGDEKEHKKKNVPKVKKTEKEPKRNISAGNERKENVHSKPKPKKSPVGKGK
ncbi:hypothetical protein KIN20_013554 [Parelaphostrongylus tenuis]|uniref:Uncharacterized protein n=1 Tax=Parelaphostrongylus tenuis TaxID=148309 RepID=A0AAD5MYA1_PARTN|nr:hypothetical protein KIN20_013554 [Parelaphostrongylus tenuis]